MRDPELVARAGYAAARLEQAWERWRALHGLGGSADPLASYVGYSLKEPMGQPRVVIGVDAAEAEFFADFLESHDCFGSGADSGPAADAGAGPTAGDPRPVNGAMPSPGSGPLHPPVNGPMHPPVGSPLHPQGSGPMHPPVNGPMHPPVSGPQRVLAHGAPRPPGKAAASGPRGTGAATAPGPLSNGPGNVPAAFGAGPADGEVARGSGPAGTPASRNPGPGAAPSRRDAPPAPMVRLLDGTDPGTRPDLLSAPAGAEHPAGELPQTAAPVHPGLPGDHGGPPRESRGSRRAAVSRTALIGRAGQLRGTL